GLQESGKIKSFSTPAALALSPARAQANRESLATIDLAASRAALEEAVASEGFTSETFASAFTLLDELARVAQPEAELPDWRTLLPKSSSWWFLVDRYFAHDPLLTTGFVTTNEPIDQAQKAMLTREMPIEGLPMTLSGWSFTLADLVPWSQRQLIVISAFMAVFEIGLLALLYRDWRLWIIHILTLTFGVTAMIASMKLMHIPLNILNVLAFRLVLAVGVDYGIYVMLMWQKARELEHDVAGVIKPVILAGLTAVAGFGALGLANNPTLGGLGIACALGIFWSLVATVFFALPAAAAAEPKVWREESTGTRVKQPDHV
ncbi:MAG TPA: MMPL family transporter, partial [Chthoniobacterales bacterium]|nr:MMPL family transporter [Chthoniobacterales bacterium]